MKTIYRTITFQYPKYYIGKDEDIIYTSISALSQLLQDFDATTITKMMCQELRELRITEKMYQELRELRITEKNKSTVYFLTKHFSLQEFS